MSKKIYFVLIILSILLISIFVFVDFKKVAVHQHKLINREMTTKDFVYSAVDFKKFDELEVNIVDDFGAIANDNKDDWKAIQLALDEVKNNGGGTVIIPEGTFQLNHIIKIYQNTRLSLSDDTTIIRKHSGLFMINGDIAAEYDEYDGNGNILVEGGTYVMNESLDSAVPGGWFGIGRAEGMILRNIVIKNQLNSHAIDLNSSRNVLIDNVHFTGFKDGTENQSKGYIEAIQIANHTEKGFMAFGKFDGKHTEKVTIQNCTFTRSDTEGFGPWPVGVGNHGLGILSEFNKDIKIQQNVFNGMTMAGIHLNNSFKDVTIETNKFYNTESAILMETTSRNYQRDATLTPELQAGKNIFIVNNLFRNTRNENIKLSGHQNDNEMAEIKNVEIIDNQFVGSQAADESAYVNIRLDLVNGIMIKNNTLNSIKNNIVADKSSFVTIENNG